TAAGVRVPGQLRQSLLRQPAGDRLAGPVGDAEHVERQDLNGRFPGRRRGPAHGEQSRTASAIPLRLDSAPRCHKSVTTHSKLIAQTVVTDRGLLQTGAAEYRRSEPQSATSSQHSADGNNPPKPGRI